MMKVRSMWITLLAVLLLVMPAAAQQPPAMVFAITQGNEVITFMSNAPGMITNRVPLTGLDDGDTIVTMDIRPANGIIYAITRTNRMVTLNPVTGTVTYIGGALTLTPGAFGLDFNPTVDRIRFTSSTGQNLRLNPNTGGLAAVDGTLNYGGTDVNAGAVPRIVASAYTNNFANSTRTTLYNIDAGLNVLTIQTPPNDGVQVTIGSLGVTAGDAASFDIRTLANGTNEAYAIFGTGFYSVNLANGAASLIGTIGEPTRAMAISNSVMPAARLPLCADFDGSTNPIVRVVAAGASGNVFCRVLVENRQFTSTLAGAQIGVQAVLDAGVIQAVDVFQQGGSMNSVFSTPAEVCLLGTGGFIYLDGTATPRQPARLETRSLDGYTCASIPNAGTVVLVGR